ncbi:ABC transporter substrate-binding protein [Neorhizobium galegae]|uniref:ABC transporter substrate-binding protein n=1 Tax=Neorhizobium galegae TaxID=399 RepID=UPI0006219547|nr:ABC transporter substrate-binding protein [Neorhizobium galegae]CDZ30502.1 NMT1/THI5 like domain protein [Neorhizobium galegae bv. officinalis]KAA9386498.1 ABC transporter substrate-binding protein [Neorhizobium galegae]KAB1111106.1 ABC transporter substrate-binding protein [Neorhizobium galegae]MCM2498612.1 ABC transporter substrate-binding protein [Neorhizobium galegae]MCQ1772232.1 ABC transporter substrate-binding protein [Neorhizobium galegae]
MISRRLFSKLPAVAALALAAGFSSAPAPALAQTAVKFTLDWKFEGPAAGFLLAQDKGYFKAEGLDVTIDTGNGSVEAIPRVATGAYQMGFGDINSLIKFLDEDPNQKIRAAMMIYERPTFAVVGRKSLGITTDPKSLEGKKLGAPPPDGAFAQWKAFKQVAKIDDSKITIESIGFPVREPMLAQGKVDAVFGFAFSVILNLKAQGIKDDDIATILMAENGLNLYGNAVLINTDFAAKNPAAVKGVLKALAKGFADAVAKPEEGVAAVLKRNETLNKDIELERLKMANAMNIKTPYVVANGFGGIDPARLTASIDTLKVSMGLKGNVKADQVFDASFLPAKEQRMLP